jgi:hypothetical protein
MTTFVPTNRSCLQKQKAIQNAKFAVTVLNFLLDFLLSIQRSNLKCVAYLGIAGQHRPMGWCPLIHLFYCATVIQCTLTYPFLHSWCHSNLAAMLVRNFEQVMRQMTAHPMYSTILATHLQTVICSTRIGFQNISETRHLSLHLVDDNLPQKTPLESQEEQIQASNRVTQSETNVKDHSGPFLFHEVGALSPEALKAQ